MDYLKTSSKALVCNALVSAGFLGVGVYLYHRNSPTECLRMLSYGVTFLGGQVTAKYLFNYEKEKDDIVSAIAKKVLEGIEPDLKTSETNTSEIKEAVDELERRRFLDDWKASTEKYFYQEQTAEVRPSELQLAVQKSPILGKQLSPDDIRPAERIVLHKLDAKIEGLEDFDASAPTRSQMDALKKEVLRVGRERLEQLLRERANGQSTQTV